MTRVLVLRTGQAVNRVHAHCGPFFQLFERGLNADGHAEHVAVDELDVTCRRSGDAMPPLDRYHGAVMTGSPAFVGDQEPWMRYGEDLLGFLLKREIPLLCVCFGHQLLGLALGAEVGPNPRGREMGTIDIELAPDDGDPLLGHLPRRFEAQCTHRDVVQKAGARLRVVGTSSHDPHHVVRAGPRAWGLQFHPEFDDVTMRLYLEVRRDVLDGELGSGACDRRIARVRATPHASSVLTRFAQICRDERVARGDPVETQGEGAVHGA